MENEEYGCNKLETFDELMEFYEEEASDYDKVIRQILNSNMQCCKQHVCCELR